MVHDYIEILKTYLMSWWKLLLIPIIFFVILMLIGILKNKNKKSIYSNVFLAVMFILLGLIKTVPVLLDISQNTTDVLEYKSAYYYNQAYFDDSYDIFAKQILVVKNDDTKIQLGDTTREFPFEMENGTIVFAEHSKIILDYTGYVIKESHF